MIGPRRFVEAPCWDESPSPAWSSAALGLDDVRLTPPHDEALLDLEEVFGDDAVSVTVRPPEGYEPWMTRSAPREVAMEGGSVVFHFPEEPRGFLRRRRSITLVAGDPCLYIEAHGVELRRLSPLATKSVCAGQSLMLLIPGVTP